jgi:hypothetical protein
MMAACKGPYIWHRLTKHIKGDPHELGLDSGANQFLDEINDSTEGHTQPGQNS